MYEDKTLVCKECGKEFVFTAGEQEFYAEKGFQNEPQRCRDCRQARKNANHPQRELRQRGQGALPAPGRPPGLLQRVLCPHEGRAGITRSFSLAQRPWQKKGAVFLSICCCGAGQRVL